MTAMLHAALDLALHGWKVFPCDWRAGKREKAPLNDHGHLEATTDPVVIRHWWSKWPRAMIGAVVAGWFVVIDVDPRNGGDLEKLIELVGPLPPTLTVWSGRNDGGRHLYFQRPLGPLTSTRLPAGIDLKLGGRGYCILPPSIHPVTGQPYRWESGEPVIMPARLQELLTPASKPIYRRSDGVVPTSDGLLRTVAQTPVGSRNNALFGRPAAPQRTASSTTSKINY